MNAGEPLPGTPLPGHFWQGADNIRIAGDAWGPEGGTLVVLLHGGGQTRHAWGGTGQLLGAAGYRAVALDARGHSDSGWSPLAKYSLDDMAADLKSVLSALGNQQPVLIGASLGGATSLLAAGEGIVDAKALILVDFVPRPEASGVERIQAFMRQKQDGFDSLEKVADAINSYRPHRARPRSLEGLAKNVRIGADGKYRWHWDPAFLGKGRDVMQRAERLSACARRLEVPTLLVRGGSSDVVSEAGAADFLALCPQAELVNVAQAGHMVAGDRNDLFGQAAIKFLSEHVPPGE